MHMYMYMYKEISGSEFNRIYKDVKLYKFLNNNLVHYDFKYQLGLNVDILPFNPNSSCSEGGLYFCQEIDCYRYFATYGEFLALIEIPNDARVYVEEFKFKTDKLIIKNITNFNDIGDDFWLKYLSVTPFCLKYIKEDSMTYEMCMLAVQRYGLALHYVKDKFLTEEICKLAVQKDGLALQYVNKDMLTEEICKLAVEQNGLALQYVNNQNEEICCRAVEQNGFALVYVKNQNEEICCRAVKQNGLALDYVNKDILTEKICCEAVKQNWSVLEYINIQNEEICSRAVEQNGLVLKYVKKQTDNICKLAVKQNGFALEYVKDQTYEICKLAVQKTGYYIMKYVKQNFRTNEMHNLAARKCGYCLDSDCIICQKLTPFL